MNSLVQCLGKVKELRNGIDKFQSGSQMGDLNSQLVVAAKKMYFDIENKGESSPPYSFVQTLRTIHPPFDEVDNNGRHRQQDSEE